MTQREKLIEIYKAWQKEMCCDICTGIDCDFCIREGQYGLVDRLLANGVAVPVRCEDCDYSDYFLMKHGVVYCYKIGREVNSGFFCADGERRTNGTTNSNSF